MKRRVFLVSLGALGGCVASPTNNSSSGGRSPTTTRFADTGCPPAPDSNTTVRCTASNTQSAIRLSAKPSSLTLPRDNCEFIFQNDSDTQLYSTPGSYQLFTYTGSRWEFIVPKVGEAVAHSPIEIESRRWDLHVNTADLGALSPASGNGDQSFTFRFPPGTYAFGFRASPKESDSDRMYTTTFTVRGQTPPLVPSDTVVSHSRHGNTLTVKTQTEKQYSDSHRVSLLLNRSSPTKQTADLTLLELYNPLYEQVASYGRTFVDPLLTELLRDGFAFQNSSDEEIHIQTIDTTIPPLGMSEDESLSVTYGKTTWELTTKKGWA